MTWFKRGIFWFLGLTALLITTGAVVLALSASWLESAAGRAWISGQIEAQVQKEGYALEIQNIRDLSLSHIDVESLSLADAGGPVLAARDIVLRYDLKTVLAGQIHFHELSVSELDLIRIPEGEEDDSVTMETPNIRINSLSFGTITYKPEGAEKPSRLSLAGALALSPDIKDSRVDLTLKDLDTEAATALLQFGADSETGKLQIKADIHDRQGGIIAGLLDAPSVDLVIDGQGEGQAWDGHIDLKIGEDIKAIGALSVGFSGKEVVLIFEGDADYEGDAFSGALKATHHLKSGKTNASFTGTYQNPEFTLKGIQADLDYARGGAYKLSGQSDQVFIDSPDEGIRYLAGNNFALGGVFQNPVIHIRKAELGTPYFTSEGTGKINIKSGDVEAKTNVKILNTSQLVSDLKGAVEADISLNGNYKNDIYEGRFSALATDLKSPVDDFLGNHPSLQTSYRYEGKKVLLQGGVFKGREIERLDFSGTVPSDFSAASLDISTAYADHKIAAKLDMTGEKLTAQNIKITGAAGTGEGKASYHFGKETIEADLRLVIDGTHHLSVLASGPYQSPAIKGTAKSALPYELAYAGNAALKDGITLTLQTLKGSLAGQNFVLQNPWDIAYEQDTLRMGKTNFTLNGGAFTFSGQAGKDSMDMAAKIDNISSNLGRFPFVFDGSISGDIALSGSYANPSGTAALNLQKISIPGIEKQLERYVSGAVEAVLSDKIITLKTDLAGPGNLEFKADAAIPFLFSGFAIPFNQAVKGNVKASVDLKALALLIGLDEHRITGRSTVDIRLSGTLDNPQINGTGSLAGGSYENLLSGTVFRDISADLDSSGNRITLKRFTGRDLNGGSFQGSGTLSLADIQNPEYDFTLEAQRLALINLDRIGLTASGTLTSRGDTNKGEVGGDIKIDQAEYYITEILATSPYSGFEITEKGQEAAPEAPAANWPDIALDVSITADHSVYVRGPELETEWAGDIKVGGLLEKPLLDGKISLVRGHYTLIDTPVQLTSGSVSFTPPDFKNPDLNISGLIKGKSLDAKLNVGGTATKPNISLSSEPSYPEDEILARALFGTSVGQLSPVQALRLAQMLAVLSGRKEAGFDPLGKLRQIISVDTLSVSMEEEGAALSVGKYINDKVYIAVDQGVTPESSSMRAEIEVTDDIEVETKLNATSETSVGVNWKHDY